MPFCEWIPLKFFRKELVASKTTLLQVMVRCIRQAITCTNVVRVPWRHVTSLGYNELTEPLQNMQMPCASPRWFNYFLKIRTHSYFKRILNICTCTLKSAWEKTSHFYLFFSNNQPQGLLFVRPTTSSLLYSTTNLITLSPSTSVGFYDKAAWRPSGCILALVAYRRTTGADCSARHQCRLWSATERFCREKTNPY